MALFCRCFGHITDFEEEEDRSSNNNRKCICLICTIRTIFLEYKAIFSNGHRARATDSTAQVADTVDAPSTNVQSDQTITLPTRTLPSDDQITTRWDEQHEGEIKDNDYNYAREVTELPLSEAERSAACSSEPQVVFLSDQLVLPSENSEVALASESSEDDECPTCLEEYIPENPRTVLRCSHSFHLGCIYEWMERSANCPICGEMMIFDEAAT